MEPFNFTRKKDLAYNPADYRTGSGDHQTPIDKETIITAVGEGSIPAYGGDGHESYVEDPETVRRLGQECRGLNLILPSAEVFYYESYKQKHPAID